MKSLNQENDNEREPEQTAEAVSNRYATGDSIGRVCQLCHHNPHIKGKFESASDENKGMA